jgi:ubiquitin carboxyl-terminal hydrolase 7
LRDCLDKLQSTERLVDENSVQCEGSCKKKTSRVTQVLFQRLPHILVIQLQRFKQSTSWFSPAIVYEKLDRKIELNNPLNLTANMFVRDKSDPVLYQLFAVCAHTGRSIDSGHYLAYIRRMENGSWIRFDDDYVEEISNAEMEEETLSTAYLLFYMRSMPS